MVRVKSNLPMFKVRDDFMTEFDSMLDSFLNGFKADTPVSSFTDGYPKVNAFDNDKEFRIEASVPGISKEDLLINFEEGILKIKGKSINEQCKENENCILRELKRSSFSRSFTFNVDVNPEEIKSTLKDGILTITIPKKEPIKPKSFNINVE